MLEPNVLALTIHQPWAAMIIAGLKSIENRSWSTQVRGKIYIHAGLHHLNEVDMASFIHTYREAGVSDQEIKKAIEEHGQYGGILGTVNLVNCVTNSADPWFYGNFGFVLESPQPFDFVRCRGRQKFFSPQVFKEPEAKTDTQAPVTTHQKEMFS